MVSSKKCVSERRQGQGQKREQRQGDRDAARLEHEAGGPGPFSELTVSASLPQIHYQKRPESLCRTEGKMGAKIHFFTESSTTGVTAGFLAQGHWDPAFGPVVLGGAWRISSTEGSTGLVERKRRFPPEFCLIKGFFLVLVNI